MAVIQLIDPSDGLVYNVNEEEAPSAMEEKGLQLATPEQVAAYDAAKARAAEQQTLGAQVVTGLEEAGRRVASLGASAVRGAAEVYAAKQVGEGRPELAQNLPTDIQGSDVAPGLYTPAAIERRELNPNATEIGGALPTAPLYAAGPAGVVAADVLSAAAAEATDAELQNRDIDGGTILANGGLNLLFSGTSFTAPIGVRKVFTSGEDILKRTAKKVAGKIDDKLLPAFDTNLKKIVANVESALDHSPVVRSKGVTAEGQKAFKSMTNSLADDHNAVLQEVLSATSDKAGSRAYEAIMEIARKPDLDSNAKSILDNYLLDEKLWPSKFIKRKEAVIEMKKLTPGPDVTPEQLRAYVDTVRRTEDARLVKYADQIDKLIDARLKINLASIPDVQKKINRISEFVTDKGVQTASTIAGVSMGGILGGVAGMGASSAVKKITGPTINKALNTAVLKTADAIKQYAANEARLTANLLVNPQLSGAYIRMGLAGAQESSPFARFRGDNESDIQAFQQQRRQLERFKRNPLDLIQTLEDEFGELNKDAPNLYKSMAEQGLRVAGFLQEKMPPARGVSMARPEGTRPSKMQLRTWALYYTAATDPQSVMESAKAGQLKKEQVETLARLWPKQYIELRTAVIEQLASNKTTTRTRQRLNLLFNFDGSLDPVLSTKSRMAAAKVREKQPPQSSPSQMTRRSPPSKAGLTPGGMSALQLGPALDNQYQ